MLSSLCHKNIVKYYGLSRSKNYLNIFLEFISGGSLESMIHKFGAMNEILIKRYTK